MMKKETAAKIESSRAKIEKIQAKIVRIQEALNGGKNPYNYDEWDMRTATQELKDANEYMQRLAVKADEETNLEANRIEAIEIFLANWREKAEGYYRNEYTQLKQYVADYEAQSDGKYNRERYTAFKKTMKERFSSVAIDLTQYGREWETRLAKILDSEKDNKRKMLILRVTKITGEITDAKALHIGDNGEINGIAVGEKGSARVETISAGGWNIQCFHFRVLVKEVA
ncbi:hypothetical protein [Paenibacillus periandrae]|uniref:hypothetical protein n=1 Tax=Paenibacillus periandrae TaxID=1761741 RepID=UPI001F093616|nr:hypothetical protein [Paenibacillus periandrae]